MDDLGDVDERDERWDLSPAERELIAAKSTANRLAFGVLFAFFREMGRFPHSPAEIEAAMVVTLARQLNLGGVLRYDRSLNRTIKRYRTEIRTVFGFRAITAADAIELTDWLRETAAPENRNLEALSAVLYAECKRRQIEPPTRQRCRRLIHTAVHAREERLYATIVSRLSATSRQRLDALLDPVESDEKPSYARIVTLRTDAGAIGGKSIREELSKLAMLRAIELPADLFAQAHPHELELYRKRVAVEDSFELRRHPEATRLTWLAAFVVARSRSIIDTLVDLLIDTVHRINAKADRRVSSVLLDDLKRVTGKTTLLYRIAVAALTNPSGAVRDVVYPVSRPR